MFVQLILRGRPGKVAGGFSTFQFQGSARLRKSKWLHVLKPDTLSLAQKAFTRVSRVWFAPMATEAPQSSSKRCCDFFKELFKPMFGRRAPPAPGPELGSVLLEVPVTGSTLLEVPVPASQRELKAQTAPQETPNQEHMVPVPVAPVEPPNVMTCLRGLRADVEDIKMALRADEGTKEDFFASAMILGGPSGMAKRPLLCVGVDDDGIVCDGSTGTLLGVAQLMLPLDHLEDCIQDWPSKKTTALEQAEAAQKQLISEKYKRLPPGKAQEELPERLKTFEHAMIAIRG
eukprot:s605_g26.t2